MRRRFVEVLANLNFIASIEPDDDSPLHIKILRGQYYVHLYGALEKTINETVEHTLLVINAKNVCNHHFKTGFNAISLHPKMQGFKTSGFKDYFNRSAEIFSLIDSNSVLDINNTIFSNALQNVWHSTIQETLQCFGIQEVNFSPRVRATIDEIVENRNAVAHGRETPSTIGERHRVDVLRVKTNEIRDVAEKIIDIFEAYISTGGFLRDECRELYEAA